MKFQVTWMLISRVLIIAFFASTAYAQQPQPAIPSLGEIKARKFVVRTIQGKNVDLAALLEQGKPVVLDLWATWCGPCRQEIPHLKELASRYSRDGLIVVGLTVEDPKTDMDAVKTFIREFAINYKTGFAPPALYLFLNNNATNYRIPQSYVFDHEGQIIRKLIGYNQTVGKDLLEKAVVEAVRRSRTKKM